MMLVKAWNRAGVELESSHDLLLDHAVARLHAFMLIDGILVMHLLIVAFIFQFFRQK